MATRPHGGTPRVYGWERKKKRDQNNNEKEQHEERDQNNNEKEQQEAVRVARGLEGERPEED